MIKADKSTEKCYAEQFSYHYSKFSGIELVLPYFVIGLENSRQLVAARF